MCVECVYKELYYSEEAASRAEAAKAGVAELQVGRVELVSRCGVGHVRSCFTARRPPAGQSSHGRAAGGAGGWCLLERGCMGGGCGWVGGGVLRQAEEHPGAQVPNLCRSE